MTRLSVIIPTWKATPYLPHLIPNLKAQSLPPHEIIVIDSTSPDGSAALASSLGCRVEVIPQAEFNHGGTRNRAAALATGDILVFMTQDALPVDSNYLAALVEPIVQGRAIASYARQTVPDTGNPLERFARQFNYPPHSHTKTNADLERLGVKTYFFSDAASAVQREAFNTVGGFPDWVIVNEDMVLCAKLLQAGHTIAYQAEAQVNHAHDYTLAQVFRRYFDIGVFMHQAREVLVGAKSGGEGLRFARAQITYLWQHNARRWIPRSIIELPLKWVAFQMGRRSHLLPPRLKRQFSAQKAYWG